MNKVVTIRKQVRLEEWAEMVRARRNSGLSVRRWCTENGVNQKTYYYRLQKVREFGSLGTLIIERIRSIQPCRF